MTNKELIELYHTCDARKDCNGCPHEHDERCAIDDVNPDTLVHRLEALMAENELLYREVAQLKAECDHFRDLTKKLWCEKRYVGEDMNVPAKWVSVDDRLPENADKQVLVVVNGVYDGIHFYDAVEIAGFVQGEGWILENWTDWEAPKVTYWQPLPEPPSTEGSPTGQKG